MVRLRINLTSKEPVGVPDAVLVLALACGNCQRKRSSRRTWGACRCCRAVPSTTVARQSPCQSCPSLQRPKGCKFPWARTSDYHARNEAMLRFGLLDSAFGGSVVLGNICPRHFARLISVDHRDACLGIDPSKLAFVDRRAWNFALR